MHLSLGIDRKKSQKGLDPLISEVRVYKDLVRCVPLANLGNLIEAMKQNASSGARSDAPRRSWEPKKVNLRKKWGFLPIEFQNPKHQIRQFFGDLLF